MWPFSSKASKPKRRSYSGAQMGRLVSDWVTSSTSGDAELYGSLRLLRDRCRELERNNDYVQSFLREVENNVVGLGIKMQAQVQMARGGKPNEAMNTAIETAWESWGCSADKCDTAGKLSFWEMELLAARAVARDGEIIFRKIKQKFGKSKIPYALEVIEADRLDEKYNGQSDAGNEIRMGVEIDQWGRPVAYYFYRYHPGDFPMIGMKAVEGPRRMRVPAEEVIHIFVTHRAGQTRGVPWIASAIMRLRHMQGYEEAEVIAARAAAAVMGFITNEEGELEGDAEVANERVTDFEPGVYKYLAPGETPVVPNTQRPGGQFSPFMKMMLRSSAAGLGISYEGISKDFSESNYSSARLSLLADRDNWRKIQKFLRSKLHQPAFVGFLEMSVVSNQLSIPDYEMNSDKYECVRWQPRGWAWVDPQKEVTAYRDAILGGLTSATKVIAQEGEDIDDLYQEIANERKLAKSLDLVFDTDAKNGIKVASGLPKASANEDIKGDETK